MTRYDAAQAPRPNKYRASNARVLSTASWVERWLLPAMLISMFCLALFGAIIVAVSDLEPVIMNWRQACFGGLM